MKWLRPPEDERPVRPVVDEQALEKALEVSRGVLFKHSPACWSSAKALRHVRAFAAQHPDVPVYLVDVLAQRALSMEAARRLGVPHESPQAIALVDGSVVWSGSHWEVTTDALSAAVVN